MAGDVITEQQYSSLAGFTFLFNVIMGNGPLALPAAFLHAGWLMSVIVLLVLCFTSFITFTFVLEAMSITNAVSKFSENNEEKVQESNESIEHREDQIAVVDQIPSRSIGQTDRELFEIDRKFELGQMFKLYFGRVGNILFYLNICIYLYGDLSIYAAGVPKSLRNVVCYSNNSEVILSDSDLCWAWSPLTRGALYRIFVVCFAVCMCPFLFFHVTRSRWLQLTTTVIRWISFILMLCLAIDRAIVLRQGYTPSALQASRAWNPSLHSLMLDSANSPEPVPTPPIVRAQGIPNLFGVCVYVFMCHHSIPGTVTPIRNKHRIMSRVFLPLFLSVVSFNLLLSGTAVAAFNEIKDLYTLNFVPDENASGSFRIPYALAQVFGYFLSLFPVFALSSTFPILGCTLLGNLMTLCNMFPVCQRPHAQRVLRYLLPLVVLLPPIFIGLLTDDIGFLVGFTGAFAGSGIQYIIPALLVYRARRYWTALIPERSAIKVDPVEPEDKQNLCSNMDGFSSFNEPEIRTPGLGGRLCSTLRPLWKSPWKKIASPHASPFQHVLWIVLLLVWSVICLAIVLVDKIHPI